MYTFTELSNGCFRKTVYSVHVYRTVKRVLQEDCLQCTRLQNSQKGTLGRLFTVYTFTELSNGCFRKDCWLKPIGSIYTFALLSKRYFRESACTAVCTTVNWVPYEDCSLAVYPSALLSKGYFRKTVCSVPFFSELVDVCRYFFPLLPFYLKSLHISDIRLILQISR